MTNGAAKGGRFEREMARTLSLWISNGEADDWLWRTSGSGGMATRRSGRGRQSSQNQHGDIASVDDRATWFTRLFNIEVKHLASIEVERALWGGAGPLVDAVHQCVRDSVDSKRVPLLVLKQNNRKPLAGLTDNSLFTLDMLCDGTNRHRDPRMSLLFDCTQGEVTLPLMMKFMLLEDLINGNTFKKREEEKLTWNGP